MIDYLMHPKFLNYDPSLPPSAQGGGGGMASKTYRVLEALKEVYPRTRGICNSAAIEAETVLIEPLRFALGTDAFEDCEPMEGIIYGLSQHKGRKILYCSELGLLRMPPQVRTQLLNVVDAITANCRFQANLFKYVGVHCSGILCDPIPDMFCRKTDPMSSAPRLLATGNVSWQKNIPQVIEVFKALKGVVERVYIGSASLWNDTTKRPGPQRLQEELYKHTDRVIQDATGEEVAREMHTSRFGLWLAYHDVFATAVHEMMMAGLPVVAAKHGLASEIPVWSASGVRAQVEAIKKLARETDESLEVQSNRISKWAAENVSYGAFQRQLTEVLRAVW